MRAKEEVDPKLNYIRKLFAQEDAVLTKIRESLDDTLFNWQVGAEEGKLLQWLAHMHNADKIVEVGTLYGYSAIWMARALGEEGRLHTITSDPQHFAKAQGFIRESDVSERVHVYHGDAHTILPTLEPAGPFDMMFIDADKISYPDYLDWAESNVKMGGLIIADNTFLFGSVYLGAPPPDVAPTTWKRMREFNERLADEEKYYATMIPTVEGMTVAIKLF